MKSALSVALLLLAAACRQETPLPPSAAPEPLVERVIDRKNLLDLTRGAVVIHRTGELKLASSALHAIDGNDANTWTSPPGDVRQSATIELAAPARVSRIGFSTGALSDAARAAKEIAFDASADGVTYRPLATASFARPGDRQTVAVTPTDVRFIRATLTKNYGEARLIDVSALVAYGVETSEPAKGPIAGEWILNRTRARFAQQGERVFGEVEMNPTMHIEGVWSGRHIRFVWTRGDKQFGLGLIAINPAGDRLNGVWFFEEAFPIFGGQVWFGEKRSANARVAEAPVLEELFDRAKRLVLYDDTRSIETLRRLLERDRGQKLRIVAHEFRGESPEDNRRRAGEAVETLKAGLARVADLSNVEFIAAGSDQWQTPASTLEEALFSRMILEAAKIE